MANSAKKNNGRGKRDFFRPKGVSSNKKEIGQQISENSLEKVEFPIKEKEKGNLIIIETNILLSNPEVINSLRVDGNLLVIPLPVISEIDAKKTSSIVGFEAREASRLIDKALDNGDVDFVIEKSQNFTNTTLDRNVPDYQIIATVQYVLNQTKKKGNIYFGYKKIKFLSNDRIVRIISKTLFKDKDISIEPLLKDRVEKEKKISVRSVRLNLASLGVIKKEGDIFIPYKSSYRLRENEIIVFNSNFDLIDRKELGDFQERFLGIRKGESVKLLSPNVKVSGRGPLSNGKINFPQVAAIHMILDPDIDALFFQGGAGTGKTFLAIAGAQQIRKDSGNNKDIIVCRVTEPIEKGQQQGFIPGGVEAKMAPWMLPIIQNLVALEPKKVTAPKKGYDESNIAILEKNDIFIQSLDYIRGATYSNTIIIIDEAQNLSPHQMKTIITRAGKGTKLIFTGDLSQIDNQSLDKKSSGLAYAINRLAGEEYIGVVTFKDVVRSRLARLAEKLM